PPPLPLQPMPADQGSRPPSWPAPPTAPPAAPPPGYQAPTLPVQPAAYQPQPEQQPPVTPPPQVVIGFQPPARERGQETVVRNFCPNCGNSLAGKAVCDNCGYKACASRHETSGSCGPLVSVPKQTTAAT